MKVIAKAAMIVGAVALVATGVGAVIGATAFASLGLGVSLATISTIGTVAGLVGTVANAISPPKAAKGSIGGSQTDFKLDMNAGIPYLIGRTFNGGNIVQRDTWGKDNQYQGFVVTYSGGGTLQSFESFLVDQTNYGMNGDNLRSPYNGWMWNRLTLPGLPAGPVTSPVAGFPGLDFNFKMSGHATGVIVLRFDVKDGKKFTGGVPRSGVVAIGERVYDPRQDSTWPGGNGPCRARQEETYVGGAAAENPWCHALTWAIGRWQNGKRVLGVGMDPRAIDIQTFVDAANVADANGWKIGGVVYSIDNKWDVIRQMAQAGGGAALRLGARCAASVNSPKVALQTINEVDLVGRGSVAASQTYRDRLNGMIPRYRSEQHGWEMVPGSVVRVASYVAADGEEKTREWPLPLVQNVKQAGELTAYELVNRREFGPIQLPVFIRFMGYKPGDALTLRVPALGLVDQMAIVRKRQIDPVSGNVQLTFLSETPSKHPFALGHTAVAPRIPDLSVADESVVAAPQQSDWIATGGELEKDGAKTPAIIVVGDVRNPSAEGFVVETRASASAVWSMVGQFPAKTTRVDITSVAAGAGYYVAVSYVQRGVLGERLQLGPVIAGPLVADAAQSLPGNGTIGGTLDPATGQSSGGTPVGVVLADQAASKASIVQILQDIDTLFETAGSGSPGGGGGSLQPYVDAARAAQAAAEAAAATASTAASNSQAAQGLAGDAATQATAARVAAEQARTDAINANNLAQSAVSNANGWASASSGSAASAASSATAAGQSATSAQGYASQASTSAGNASLSATGAATSATNASGSASSAATSANVSAQALSAAVQAAPKPTSFAAGRSLYTINSLDPGGLPWPAVPDANYSDRGSGGVVLVVSTAVRVSFRTLFAAGRRYRLSAKYRAVGADGNATFYLNYFNPPVNLVASDYPGPAPVVTVASGWQTSAGDRDLTGAFPYPLVGPELLLYPGNGGTMEVEHLRMVDVTEEFAASIAASAAATSASNAAASNTAAGQSASAAQQSATNAATQAGNASTYATQASTSASNAAGSASSAGTSAGNAAGSANAAGGSAQAASGSASTASTSASNAANSATAAASSLVSATLSANRPSSFAGPAQLYTVEGYGSPTLPWPAIPDAMFRTDFSLGRIFVATSAQVVTFRVPSLPGRRRYRVEARARALGANGTWKVNVDKQQAPIVPSSRPQTVGEVLNNVDMALPVAAGWTDFSMVFDFTNDTIPTVLPRAELAPGAGGSIELQYLRAPDVTEQVAAANSASAAAASASSASASETAAGVSAQAANTSAINSSTSAGNSASSASAASGSATNAATSAGGAAGSASSASTSANNAETSAGQASVSASAASTSAATSSTQAAAASQSATLAASVSTGLLGNNPVFNRYTNAVGEPDGWTDTGFAWQGATRQPGLVGKYSYDVETLASHNGKSVRVLPNPGGIPDALGKAGAGWFVYEVDVELISGGIGEAYVGNIGGNAQEAVLEVWGVYLKTVPDTAGIVGQGAAGSYRRWRILFQMVNPAVTYGIINMQLALPSSPNRLRWHKVGFRAATPLEVQAGRVSDLAASVSQSAAATALVDGRTQAYWAVSANAGGASAAIEARAVSNPDGSQGSRVGIVAEEFSVTSTTAGVRRRVMRVVGSDVVIDGNLSTTSGVFLGSGAKWAYQLKTQSFMVSDGQAVAFGLNLGGVPTIDFQSTGLAPLAAGETYKLYADELTATGFRARLRIITPGASGAYSNGASTVPGSGPTRQVSRTAGGPEASNGVYTVYIAGVYSGYSQYAGGGNEGPYQ